MQQLPRRLSKPGPVLDYLFHLRRMNPALADEVVAKIRVALSGEGAIVLDLLEKSTLLSVVPTDAEPRALDAINAQSFIALDLRRIVSDELDELSQRQDGASARNGNGRR